MALKIVSIGSSSSGNSYIITDGRTRLLLDAGLSGKVIKAALADLGLTPLDINGILITHEHTDHVKSIRMMAKECANAVVASSRGTAWSCPNFEHVPSDRLVLVSSQDEFMVGGLAVKAFALSHDAAEPLSYTVRETAGNEAAGSAAGGTRLTVVTDTGTVTDEIFEEMRRADKLVLEANHEVAMLEVGPYPYPLKKRILSDLGHLSNEAAGNALAEILEERRAGHKAAKGGPDGNRALKVMLAHLSTTNNTPDNAGLTVSEVLRGCGFSMDSDYIMNIAAKSRVTGMYDGPEYGIDEVTE